MIRPVVLVVALAFLGASCGSVASLRPIFSDPDEPIVDARVEGQWRLVDLDSAGVDPESEKGWTITRTEATDRYYVVDIRGDDDVDGVTVFDAWLVPIDGRLFFDAEFRSETRGQAVSTPSGPFLVPGHAFGRIWLEDDFIRLASFDPDWVQAYMPDSAWVRYPEQYQDDVLITAPTEEVRRLVQAHADDRQAFQIPLYLCRPGTDCKPRAVEEELARRAGTEDADDFAGLVADVFAVRGDHIRAIELRRQRVAFDPDDPRRHLELGVALLLNRDFADARTELAAAAELEASHPVFEGAVPVVAHRALAHTAWSYFVEGRYADVVGTVAMYAPPGEQASADPILLDYYSRIRLGRRADAEAMLGERTASFVGIPTEHLHLLSAGPRLVRAPWWSDSDRSRAAFFTALRDLADGRASQAILALRNASRDPDSVVGLAARVELERLGVDLQP